MNVVHQCNCSRVYSCIISIEIFLYHVYDINMGFLPLEQKILMPLEIYICIMENILSYRILKCFYIPSVFNSVYLLDCAQQMRDLLNISS